MSVGLSLSTQLTMHARPNGAASLWSLVSSVTARLRRRILRRPRSPPGLPQRTRLPIRPRRRAASLVYIALANHAGVCMSE